MSKHNNDKWGVFVYFQKHIYNHSGWTVVFPEDICMPLCVCVCERVKESNGTPGTSVYEGLLMPKGLLEIEALQLAEGEQ